MYCKDCKVEVVGNNTVCPLCHKPLEGESGQSLFAQPKKQKKDFRKRFTKIYELTCLPVYLVFVCLNYFFLKNYLYDIFLLTVLFGIYLTIRFTALGSISFGSRWLLQSSIICAILFETEYIFSITPFTFGYAVPILNVACCAAIWIYYLFANDGDRRSAHLSLLTHGIFGLIQIVFYAFEKAFYTTTIPLIISVTISFLNIIMVVSLHYKEIVFELKKRFHI